MPRIIEQVTFEAAPFDHTNLNLHVKKGRRARAAVMFIHGLDGDGYETWGAWPQLVFDQSSVEPLDVVLYEYASARKAWKRWHLGADLPFLASQLADWVRVLGEDHDYEDIYFVAHSLGGLLAESAVQKYLMALGTGAPEVTSVAAIYMLASPRMGAGLALAPLRKLLPELEWLRAHSPQAMDAESFFTGHVESLGTAASAGHRDFLIPRYSAIAGGDRLVSKMSGLFGVPEGQRLRLSGNHRSIVKPDDINQEQHRRLLKIVSRSGEIRRAWRRQKRHEVRFAQVGQLKPSMSQVFLAELRSDNLTGAWEKAYNDGCASVEALDIQILDRRNPITPSGQPTDLLITVHDAGAVLDQDSRCRLVVEDAFQEHERDQHLTLLIVPVGPGHEEAVSVVRSWLPAPPHRSLSVEGSLSPEDFTGRVAQWIDVVIGRDPVRWPRSRPRSSYGSEGRDFV